MRIQTSTASKKPIIISLIIVLVLASGTYTALAYSQGLWPFTSTVNQDGSNQQEEVRDENTPSKPDTESPTGSETPQNPDTDTNYVNPPLTESPATNAPYPIENEKYKITQDSEKSFTVTLYPIVNNPEYSDYTAQLKAYKNEVLTYLKNRYGSTSNLVITWNPSDAQNL